MNISTSSRKRKQGYTISYTLNFPYCQYYVSNSKIKFPQLKVQTARLIPNTLQLPLFLHVRFVSKFIYISTGRHFHTNTLVTHLYRGVKSTSCFQDYQMFDYFGPIQTIIQTVNLCLKLTHHFGSNQQIKGALPHSHMHLPPAT